MHIVKSRTLGCGAAALAAAAALLLGAGPAAAQTAPSDFRGLSDLFRASVQLQRGATVIGQSAYGFQSTDDAIDFLREENLRARFPTYTGREAVTGTLDFRGVPVIGRYAENSNQFIVDFPTIGERRVFNGLTRSQAYDAADFYFDELPDGEAEDLIRRLLASLAAFSPVDPLAGNPNSLQGSLVRGGLDLTSPGGALEDDAGGGGAGAANQDEPAWMIGATYSDFTAGRFEGRRLDLRGERSWRVGEGSRSRLKLDVPFTLTETEGASQVVGSVGLGYERPVIPGRWSLEPRVAYGAVVAPDLGSAGHMGSASLTSRYRIDGPGRGFAIIGNMIGYTTTLPLDVDGTNYSPEVSNVVFRNGVAYQYPLNRMVSGRAASVRASYTHTGFTGDELFLDSYHELGLSFGVRGREDSPRNAFELFRLTGAYTFGDDYDSVTVGVGYRF